MPTRSCTGSPGSTLRRKKTIVAMSHMTTIRSIRRRASSRDRVTTTRSSWWARRGPAPRFRRSTLLPDVVEAHAIVAEVLIALDGAAHGLAIGREIDPDRGRIFRHQLLGLLI